MSLYPWHAGLQCRRSVQTFHVYFPFKHPQTQPMAVRAQHLCSLQFKRLICSSLGHHGIRMPAGANELPTAPASDPALPNLTGIPPHRHLAQGGKMRGPTARREEDSVEQGLKRKARDALAIQCWLSHIRQAPALSSGLALIDGCGLWEWVWSLSLSV